MFLKSRASRYSTWTHHVAVALLGLTWLTLAHAQPLVAAIPQGPAAQEVVSVRLEQFKVAKNDAGQETLLDAKTVRPGDVIEYRATYKNQDSRPVKGVQATLPIPNGMRYLPLTARPGAGQVLAATGAGHYAPEPLMQTIKVNGKPQSEPVPYQQYRSLRWDLGNLSPGAEAVVSARTQVDGGEASKANLSIPADKSRK